MPPVSANVRCETADIPGMRTATECGASYFLKDEIDAIPRAIVDIRAGHIAGPQGVVSVFYASCAFVNPAGRGSRFSMTICGDWGSGTTRIQPLSER